MHYILTSSVQRRLNQSNGETRRRQFDLREQQQRFIDDESRAKAEISEGERAYVLFPYPFASVIKNPASD
jgi:hypothetical protein